MNIHIKIILGLLFIVPNFVYSKGLPDLEIPSFMQTSIIRGGVNLGGLDVKTYVFKSSKGSKEILKFYNKLWKGNVKTVKTHDWIYHTYFDGNFLYSIQVRTKGMGGSFFKKAAFYEGIIGISQPNTKKVVKNNKVKFEDLYPLTPGSRILNDLSSVDLGKKSRTSVIDSPGSVITNLSHYKLHFEKQDWTEILNNMSLGMAKELGGASLVMQKGNDELVVNFLPNKDRTKIVSVLVTK